MITLSSRFLALLMTAVVAVSLMGSMLGYAIGSRGPRSGFAGSLQPVSVTSPMQTTSVAPAPQEREVVEQKPVVSEEPVAEVVAPQPPRPTMPARIADTPKMTELTLGATAAKGGVAATLTNLAANKCENGMEVQLMLTNTSGRDLNFLFTPEVAIKIDDNRGVHWDLRWAEYEGAFSLPNGEKRQLVRALYHGDLGNPDVDHVTLTLRETAGLEEASWTVPVPRQPATP